VPKGWGCVQQSPIDFIAVAVADLAGACSFGPSNSALAQRLYHRRRSAKPSSMLTGWGCVAPPFNGSIAVAAERDKVFWARAACSYHPLAPSSSPPPHVLLGAALRCARS
jgi:hypothetical protein